MRPTKTRAYLHVACRAVSETYLWQSARKKTAVTDFG